MHRLRSYPPVLNNKASNLRYSSNRLKNTSNVIVQQWLDIMLHYENYHRQFVIEKYRSSSMYPLLTSNFKCFYLLSL